MDYPKPKTYKKKETKKPNNEKQKQQKNKRVQVETEEIGIEIQNCWMVLSGIEFSLRYPY